MAHLFDPPIDYVRDRAGVATPSAGLKRKRHAAADSDASDESDEQAPPSDQGENVEQANVPSGFPHVPLDRGPKVQVNTKQRNLKHQHFHVLNAILHRCLLDHDFERASKAFGLLLRFEIRGMRMDLRNKGLWGIGAEVLLRRKSAVLDEEEEEDSNDADLLPFTQAGFEAAKEYYQRLILQYPYRKHRSKDVNAQSFYPAMFTVWIFQVQQRRKLADAAALRASPPLTQDAETVTIAREVASKQARLRELDQAREIRTSISNLTDSPPYDRDPNLLKLQANVERWIADLIMLTSSDEDGVVAGHLHRAHLDSALDLYTQAREHGALFLDDEDKALARQISSGRGAGISKADSVSVTSSTSATTSPEPP